MESIHSVSSCSQNGFNLFNTHMKGTQLKSRILSGCSVYTNFISIYLIHYRRAVMLLESFKEHISIKMEVASMFEFE